jgi:hypothetical protein
MNACQPFYTFVTSLSDIWSEYWATITMLWNACVSQSCSWWCLCCNVWLCCLLVITVTVIYFLLMVLMSVFAILLVPVCWGTCLLIAVLIAIGGGDVPNCFNADPSPAPATPTPMPAITIDQPPDNSSFPAGDSVPIAFSATVIASDGSTPANPDVRWEIVFGQNSPTIALGAGLQFNATLPHLQADIDAGRPSHHVVQATVVEGNLSAFAVVHVTVGVSIT